MVGVLPNSATIPLSVGTLHYLSIRHRLSLLEFDQPPPNLDFDLVTRPTHHFVDPFSTVHDAIAVLHPPLVLALATYYISLDHQGVQKLLLDDNTPPTVVCIYTEEDVMRIFEGIAPDYVNMCSEYPPSSLAESDRRVMFFENMQWFFRNKRSTYLSTRKF
ncbi:hypothetical protein PGTUg99_031091 [Puccinia graminis f. sp. tritici]|uniref:Uncharacterized protein n=1 Tax=Puccinia graminis f. sp. tritici TaxID=56615 RepID=A0A5B0RLY4_PUCGR|nr:hypothetical protein PGTUg99_031091 [Puccinia graminis f. sp. tritici]